MSNEYGTPSATSPAVAHPLTTAPVDPTHAYRGNYIPNTPLAVSFVSFTLGATFVSSLALWLRPDAFFGLQNEWSPLGYFIASLAAFHWGEFAVAAGWNLDKCSVDSFLLENGRDYHIAHAVAVSEFIITTALFPSFKHHYYITRLGYITVIAAQAVRSLAMIHANTNFSHQIATKKTNEHRLVTEGIYAYLRHPSYAGFFYWSLGTQLVLQNPFSFLAYLVVTFRFFRARIRYEEAYLIKFFGDSYRDYKKRVGTGIPLIK